MSTTCLLFTSSILVILGILTYRAEAEQNITDVNVVVTNTAEAGLNITDGQVEACRVLVNQFEEINPNRTALLQFYRDLVQEAARRNEDFAEHVEDYSRIKVFENYMIEELVQQFEKLRDAVRSFSPKTKLSSLFKEMSEHSFFNPLEAADTPQTVVQSIGAAVNSIAAFKFKHFDKLSIDSCFKLISERVHGNSTRPTEEPEEAWEATENPLEEQEPTEQPEPIEEEPTEQPELEEVEPTEQPELEEVEPTEQPELEEVEPTEQPEPQEI